MQVLVLHSVWEVESVFCSGLWKWWWMWQQSFRLHKTLQCKFTGPALCCVNLFSHGVWWHRIKKAFSKRTEMCEHRINHNVEETYLCDLFSQLTFGLFLFCWYYPCKYFYWSENDSPAALKRICTTAIHLQIRVRWPVTWSYISLWILKHTYEPLVTVCRKHIRL